MKQNIHTSGFLQHHPHLGGGGQGLQQQTMAGSEISGSGIIATKPSQVNAELSALEKAVALLSQIVITHITSLDSVLRPAFAAIENGESAEEELVPLANDIRKVRKEVHRLGSMIESVVERVEL